MSMERDLNFKGRHYFIVKKKKLPLRCNKILPQFYGRTINERLALPQKLPSKLWVGIIYLLLHSRTSQCVSGRVSVKISARYPTGSISAISYNKSSIEFAGGGLINTRHKRHATLRAGHNNSVVHNVWNMVPTSSDCHVKGGRRILIMFSSQFLPYVMSREDVDYVESL